MSPSKKRSSTIQKPNNKRIQELTEEIEATEYTLSKNKHNMTSEKQDQYLQYVAKLTKALKEEKIKNYDLGCKDKAQVGIMLEMKKAIEERNSKITILEKNSSMVDSKEIRKKIKEANDDVVTEKLMKQTKQKYDNYVQQWLNECGLNETAKKKH
jgi:hypothetical protein